MVSALTVLFLGCWLARQSGVSGQGSLPKPSISVSPGGVIPVGGNVIIRCHHQRLGMRFLLYKAGDGNYLTYMDPAGSEAEFPITSARREHGGSYTCRYSNRTVRAAYSEPSDPVQIIVADPSLPRPSISLSLVWVTAPGADATIRCQGQRRDVRFFLHKAGDLNPQQHMDPAGDGAEFRIPTVGRQHGGSYSCSYRPQSEPFVSSQPSDPVQLVVAEPSYPKPNISLRPSGRVALGGAVTIRCECRCAGARVLLSKAGDPDAQRSMDSTGDMVEFPIRNVRRGDVGSYSCRYSTKWDPPIWSEPSDPVELMLCHRQFISCGSASCLLCLSRSSASFNLRSNSIRLRSTKGEPGGDPLLVRDMGLGVAGCSQPPSWPQLGLEPEQNISEPSARLSVSWAFSGSPLALDPRCLHSQRE
ncbi:immunoglobulin superfamily member 1-like [Emys orbicularis]|uniref:immunoglobulin superfamily member 1-like n=1 Tax=Emys orbicularis TaxID=82168 RepID=UPI0031FDD1BA